MAAGGATGLSGAVVAVVVVGQLGGRDWGLGPAGLRGRWVDGHHMLLTVSLHTPTTTTTTGRAITVAPLHHHMASNTPPRIATPPARPLTHRPPHGSFHAHGAILTAAVRGQQAGRACGRGEGRVCAMAGRGVSAPLRGAADWRTHTHSE